MRKVMILKRKLPVFKNYIMSDIYTKNSVMAYKNHKRSGIFIIKVRYADAGVIIIPYKRVCQNALITPCFLY